MRLHEEVLQDIRRFITEKADNCTHWQKEDEKPAPWIKGDKNNIILKADTGLELGGPGMESLSFLVWTNDLSLISDNKITLMGADLQKVSQSAVPFGKVVMIGGQDFNPQNAHERFREMDLQRFDLNLKGYMVRAVSQEMKEWSRVSKEALNNGFSFFTLGSSMIDKYKALDYVTAAEVLFISSSKDHISELRPTGEKVKNYVSAMRKMIEELSYDCANCDFQNFCKEIDDLKILKKSLKKLN